MKVGDYVRFYDRSWTEIGQIVGEVEDSHLKVVKCRDGYYDLDNFIKSSSNIIDLIEGGDYVNGLKVDKIDENGIYNSNSYDGWLVNIASYNEEIKSIVTKESMESVTYYVK